MARNSNKTQGIEQAEPVLSGQQEIVIMRLLEGCTQKDAAEHANVRPEQVSRWLHGDPLFVATLNHRRQQLWQANQAELLAMATEARQVLRESMQRGPHRLKAALAILDRLPKQVPAGPATAKEAEIEFREKEKELFSLDLFAGMI